MKDILDRPSSTIWNKLLQCEMSLKIWHLYKICQRIESKSLLLQNTCFKTTWHTFACMYGFFFHTGSIFFLNLIYSGTCFQKTTQHEWPWKENTRVKFRSHSACPYFTSTQVAQVKTVGDFYSNDLDLLEANKFCDL